MSLVLVFGLGVSQAAAAAHLVSGASASGTMSSAAGSRAVAAWEAESNEWRYGTSHFFALSRGLEDQPLAAAAKIVLLSVTLPLDLVMLPTAALAGLWGD